MDPAMMQDGAQEETMGTGEAGDVGYTVCISVAPGAKQFSVGVDGGEAMAQPPGVGFAESEPETDAGYKQANSLKEALTIAMEIIRNDGAMPDEAVGDAEFNSGFTSREPM